MNQKSLDKKKGKELDWSWIKLDKPLEVIVSQGMDRPFLVYGFNLFKQRVNLEVNNLLTQQRTELEQQKIKVVWNDVCEQIKKETRTELLEEIKKLKMSKAGYISSMSSVKNHYEAKGWDRAVEAINNNITNLLNKKYETN